MTPRRFRTRVAARVEALPLDDLDEPRYPRRIAEPVTPRPSPGRRARQRVADRVRAEADRLWLIEHRPRPVREPQRVGLLASLGIRSPSHVFADLGRDVVDGLVLGSRHAERRMRLRLAADRRRLAGRLRAARYAR